MKKTTFLISLAVSLYSNGIQIRDEGQPKAYIYFKDKKVVKVTSSLEDAKEMEIAKYYGNSTFFHALPVTNGTCGTGGQGPYGLLSVVDKSKDKKTPASFCESKFTEMTNAKTGERVVWGLLTFGTALATYGTLHERAFSSQAMHDYIADSNIKDFEPLLKFCKGKNITLIRDFNFDDLLIDDESSNRINKLSADNIIIFDKSSNKWIYVDRDLNPNQLVAIWVKDIMEPRQLSPVTIPHMILDPFVPPVVELAKDEFETKSQYKARLDQAIKDREKIIVDNQKQYAKDIVERNKEVNRLREEYKKEIAVINIEQDEKQKKLAPQIEQYAKLAFLFTRKPISLTNPMYDAETGIMEVNVSVKPSYESKLITFKQNADEARYFKNNLHSVTTEAEYEDKNNTFRLKKLISKYDGKTYTYDTSIAEFPPERVTLDMNKKEGFKIVFTPEQESTMFTLQDNQFIQKKSISAKTSIKKKSSAN